MEDIAPAALRELLATEPVVMLDVREPWEFALCHLEGSQPVPLESLPERLDALAADALTVVLCHHGVRSQYAAAYLCRNGFSRVYNLAGGIDRWADELDPTMIRY